MRIALKLTQFIAAATSLFLWASASSSFSFSPTPNKRKDIDEKFLDISADGKTLYGFKNDIDIQTIVDEKYNSLAIPESVTKIDDYAFADIFDKFNLNINSIFLTDHLEEIGNYAFFRCSSIKYVNFESLSEQSQLKRIGNDCFDMCNLNCNILLPNKIQYIGNGAFFQGIVGENTIVFPSSVEYVGNQAFAMCSKIAELDFSAYKEIPDWLLEANSIFLDSSMDVLSVKCIANTKVDTSDEWSSCISNRQKLSPSAAVLVYDSQKTVPNDAFITESRSIVVEEKTVWQLWLVDFNFDKYGPILEQYDNLVIPEGIEYIDTGVFAYPVPYLKPHMQLTLPNSLLSIGNAAFSGCSWLCGNLNIPISVTSIGRQAFDVCTFSGPLDLTSGGVREELNIGEKAFAYNDFESVAFDSTTHFDKNCFSNNYNLHILDLSSLREDEGPHSKTGVTEEQFLPSQECGVIIWPKTGKTTEDEKWRLYFEQVGLSDRLSQKKWIEINKTPDDTTTSITDFVTSSNYLNVYGLSQDGKSNHPSVISFHENTRNIKPESFNGQFVSSDEDFNFKTLIFNKGLQTIGDNAFQGCDGIFNTNLELPRSIKTIGAGAFQDNTNMMINLRLPQNLTEIGDNAFSRCVEMISNTLEIPSTVKKIGKLAFSQLKFVNVIKFHSLVSDLEINSQAFSLIKYINAIDFSEWGENPPENLLHAAYDAFNLNNSEVGSFSPYSSNKVIILSKNASINNWTKYLKNTLGFDLDGSISGKKWDIIQEEE